MDKLKDIKIVEAILFASNEPVSENELRDKIVNKKMISNYLRDLEKFYSNRGINLKKTGSKWSFRTSSDLSDELIIFKEKKRKISRAALETLAIIAYQQPITRPEIENVRGVQMGRGSIDHLMQIGWIKPKGRKKIPGQPSLWVTTKLFLEHFGLDSLENLPNKKELIASGFLEKGTAISKITELAINDEYIEPDDYETIEEENLEDFISEK